MRYYDNVVELIGHTPLVRLHSVTDGIRANVLAKIEYLNPGGSVKDRIALRMVEEAEKSGLLAEGGTIVEPTSGNTGVGLALVAQLKGYRCVFVCPDKVSEDKRNVLRAYGAEVVVCPTAVAPEDPRSYYNVSDRLSQEIPGAWKPNQYANPANPRSHYETTGPEIWSQTDGRITHFVAGVGTGGTITGVGQALKEHNPKAQIVAVEPLSSPVLSGGPPGPHRIQGIGAGFVPEIFNRDIVDEIVQCPDEDAIELAKGLARVEGVLAGMSCGAALYGARVELVESLGGMNEAVDAARAAAQDGDVFLPDQFSNPANPEAHRTGTGPEILEALDG
ncbi:MAG TPA: cysteine synthase family protein, partial [Asanoa sp.]